ncbi:putative nucleotidyltransferase [Bacillus pakistanensis]|uniref:Nucleotidyltransferase n=1 Tax=Rossellomorea pakistanensis TaxID=992288 RepID=A0ABS2NII6_9BACI|nr:aminoglycoside 6-adenylyltransferase [Bacillus pakistanensis]MBM7587687.1 putative nucleotidyltransferase [Bacillus pakistanensis]
MITKQLILTKLQKSLIENPNINAMWLEGSDGTGSADNYSDLDIVMDVVDGFEADSFHLIEKTLQEIGPLDLNSEESYQPLLKYKVYHLQGTPEFLFLDVTIQSESRRFKFTIENDSEVPYVLFDKKGIIQYQSLDKNSLHQQLIKRLISLENTMKQKARAEKYIARGKFMEAFGYYQKFVLEPLVELLRINYKPINHDYYIVSISKHLPKDVCVELEGLFKNSSLDELKENICKAYEWFYRELPKVREKLNRSVRMKGC